MSKIQAIQTFWDTQYESLLCVLTSVHDSFVVHVLEGATELNKVLPNGSFGNEAALLLEMFDHLCQVTGVC